MRLFISALFISVMLVLAGCADDSDKKAEEKPVEALYNEASDALDKKDYKEATRLYEEVERQHPYSQWATQAQLMGAYASYQAENYDEAVLALDRFIELHPGSKDIAYAYYLKALCFYEQISDVRRDQQMTKDALAALDTLIKRFPESDYTRDAARKRDLSVDNLKGEEIEIGRYYLKKGEINAAINRFRAVVKEYQTTTHIPEALHRLVECYMTLGLKNEATHVAAVLGYNYPGNKWYERSYALLDDDARQKLLDDRSFIDRTVESVFK